MEFDINKFEDVLNEILPGLTMYVRDVNLSRRLSEKYIVGSIILERGYTDASSRVGGMVTTHRFAILSNHMTDLSDYEQGTNWGLNVAERNSHYLILDNFEYLGKTQIVLLHLPNDKRWKLFQNVKINVLDDLVRDLRKKFAHKCMSKAIDELSSKEWLKRCTAPLGMDEGGNLFDLNVNLKQELKLHKIGNANFRDLYHKIIYIESNKKLKEYSDYGLKGLSDDGFLAYGYIDDEAGFTFRLLCSANIKDNVLSIGKYENKIYQLVRKGMLNECNFLYLDYCDFESSTYSSELEMINLNYRCKNKETEDMRKFSFLDSVRNVDFPDDIQVILHKKGLKPEKVWVRCWMYTDDELFGKLLNEPFENYDIHKDDIIGFAPIKDENQTLCVFTGKTLIEKE